MLLLKVFYHFLKKKKVFFGQVNVVSAQTFTQPLFNMSLEHKRESRFKTLNFKREKLEKHHTEVIIS